MASNSEIEMTWVNAWSDLYELIRDRADMRCQLPDGTIVSVEECKGWLQESAYAGHLLDPSKEWSSGREVIIASSRPRPS